MPDSFGVSLISQIEVPEKLVRVEEAIIDGNSAQQILHNECFRLLRLPQDHRIVVKQSRIHTARLDGALKEAPGCDEIIGAEREPSQSRTNRRILRIEYFEPA